jgi:inosine-uridine nucleoside N-ribohydrolase
MRIHIDTMGDLPEHDRYWDAPVEAEPVLPHAATRLLAHAVSVGAVIAAIGPYTNLALLGPRQLATARIVAMGGWLDPPAEGLPQWGPRMDWNVQCDTQAAAMLAAHAGDLTWCLLPATMPAHLRERDLSRLQACGPIGELLARQSATYGRAVEHAALGQAHHGLPDDLVNFHWDPLACALALGWPGAATTRARLTPVVEDGWLRLRRDDAGRPVAILVGVDGPAFTEAWLAAVSRATAGDPATGGTS